MHGLAQWPLINVAHWLTYLGKIFVAMIPGALFAGKNYRYTEGVRLSAIYAVIFTFSVIAIGALVLFRTEQALRDEILQSARVNILAMKRAYHEEGLNEVLEVVSQLKGAPGEAEDFLVQMQG